ncbi:hypothetical protein, partial [Atlantibacter hermannii]
LMAKQGRYYQFRQSSVVYDCD